MTRKEALIAGIASLTALAAGSSSQAEETAKHPEIDQIRALLKAHDKAFTNQDLPGVLACLTPGAAIMGTGPGEIWVGPAEIKNAYQHFFEEFDKGQQKFDYHFKIGSGTTDMGWLMASGDVTGKKGGKKFAFPLNLSITVSKKSGSWLIAAMHFSTLTNKGA